MDDECQPEDVLVEFLLANLTGDEDAIRPWIIDHPDAAVLWQGAYPPDVAAVLAERYQGMAIARLEEDAGRVLLRYEGGPIPLEVRLVEGEWRLDVSPIIKVRKGMTGG